MMDSNKKNDKKNVTIVIPTFNEEENIPLIYESVTSLFQSKLLNYDYRILFVDNCSKDDSQKKIRLLAKEDAHVQYIFYVRNFGFSKSTFYGLTQAEGDCAVLLFADMQDPPELIADFLEQWEAGYPVVVGIKHKSQENKAKYKLRQIFYHMMKKITDIEHIEQFTGFGLYDRTVLNTLARVDDALPYLRGIIAELTPECQRVYYSQNKRKYGKSSFKFWNLYDVAMLGITSYSRVLMRIAIIIGSFTSIISMIIAVVTFFLKAFKVIEYPIGNAAILFGVYFLGGVILIFLGILGEYVANINIRTMHHPIIVEEERYNLKAGCCNE